MIANIININSKKGKRYFDKNKQIIKAYDMWIRRNASYDINAIMIINFQISRKTHYFTMNIQFINIE